MLAKNVIVALQMDSKFDHKKIEQNITELWQKGGYFKAQRDAAKKPFTIVLPPPNASGKMHTGNVLMIAIEDLLIRYKRMQGYSALWVPGTDHAGFETQITFERELRKQNKSRFDYDRNTLYQMIWDFVHKNRQDIEHQITKMGASVDWSRYTFTLDPHVIKTVYDTFTKMYSENLIYRNNYMVNYCPKCGTTFADLEIIHKERKDALYYIRYPLLDRQTNEPEYLVVATTRPEPIMVDTHLAVNPTDKKLTKWIGRKVANPPTGEPMEIIGDTFVDKNFGTGIVKLTPAHDKTDYDVAKKHGLPIISVVGLDGRMNDRAGEFKGLPVAKARDAVVAKLIEKNLLDKMDADYLHNVAVCYKGEHDIEPMVLPNWFIKVADLKKPALDVVKKGKVKIFPKWRTITYTRWMEEMHDWPISRQVVWGIRIPVWYNIDDNRQLRVTFVDQKGINHEGTVSDLIKDYTLDEIKFGLQTLMAPMDAKPIVSAESPGDRYLQETDTFDTWFSSGHWPLVTLHYPDSEDFAYFYPTSVMETGWEIIRLWVSRMIMFGMYLTRDSRDPRNFDGNGVPPFETIYLHGLVRAIDGRKMSKSLGNIINPEEYQETYGTDALRMGLISGTANGKDFAFPKDKIIGYRNFANKIWNMARFMLLLQERYETESGQKLTFPKRVRALSDSDKQVKKAVTALTKQVQKDLNKYRFADAGEKIYQFMWHTIADTYIEEVKAREDKAVALPVLFGVFSDCLKLLHPFMPFVTEAVWQELPKDVTGGADLAGYMAS
jgi:valyl-tRNA synthetase